MTKALLDAGWQRSQPERFWLWLIQSPDPELMAFGVRSQHDPQTGTIFSELWVDRVRKAPPLPLNLTPSDIRALYTMWQDPGASLKTSDLARAVYFRLVRQGAGKAELVTPCVNPSAMAGFDGLFGETARRIVRRTLLSRPEVPTLPAVFADRRDVYRHVFARLLMQSSLRELVRHGILQLPRPAVEAVWGTWLAAGPEAYRHFAPPAGFPS